MKYGLLIYKNSYNLGDEIQSIAAKQYLPQVNYLIDRDSGELSCIEGSESDEKVKVIYNGWFDGQYCKFPPCEKIEPLFISFHLNEIDHSKDKSYDFLKKNDQFISLLHYKDLWQKNQPILCRDTITVSKFKSIGIDAEFSGCLTLTLEKKGDSKRGEEILVVDTHCLFKELYFELVPKEIREKAITLCQSVRKILSHEEKMKLAQKHLERLQTAKLVITSRLHTLLPCVAYKTPVIFIHGDANDIRFSGLKEFFRIYGKGDLVDYSDFGKHVVENEDLDRYVEKLKQRVQEFVREN